MGAAFGIGMERAVPAQQDQLLVSYTDRHQAPGGELSRGNQRLRKAQ